MATVINFTTITAPPSGSVADQAVNVPNTANIVLRVFPELGNGQGGNGGASSEAAIPRGDGMLDSSGFVLPQYARLYRTSQLNGTEIGGTSVPLKLVVETSGFRNGVPVGDVYTDLRFVPAVKLENLVTYEFSYSPALPGVWQPKTQLGFSDQEILTASPGDIDIVSTLPEQP